MKYYLKVRNTDLEGSECKGDIESKYFEVFGVIDKIKDN